MRSRSQKQSQNYITNYENDHKITRETCGDDHKIIKPPSQNHKMKITQFYYRILHYFMRIDFRESIFWNQFFVFGKNWTWDIAFERKPFLIKQKSVR